MRTSSNTSPSLIVTFVSAVALGISNPIRHVIYVKSTTRMRMAQPIHRLSFENPLRINRKHEEPALVHQRPMNDRRQVRQCRNCWPNWRCFLGHGYPSASPIQSKERLVHVRQWRVWGVARWASCPICSRTKHRVSNLDMRQVEQVMIRMPWINVRQVGLSRARMHVSTPQHSWSFLSELKFRIDRSYQGDRYKDEANDYQHQTREFQPQHDSPASKSSFRNHLSSLDHRFNGRQKGLQHVPTHWSIHRLCFLFDVDDDVLSVNSARSLSSSCSLASQTLELAQQNLHKYWGDKWSTALNFHSAPRR